MHLTRKRLNLLCVLLIYSLDSFGIAIVYPIFTPIFLAEHTPFFLTETSLFYRTCALGVILSLFPIAQFFGAPLIGDFSDKVGRKKTLSLTLGGSAIAYALSALSIFLYSLPLLFLARFIGGFFAGNTSLCFATISDLSSNDQERSKNFGFVGAFGGLSFFISILCAEFFFNAKEASSFSSMLPFLITCALSTLTLIFLLCVFQDAKESYTRASFSLTRGYEHIRSTFKNKSLTNAYFLFFFFSIGWIATMQFYVANLMQIYHKIAFDSTINLLLVGVMWSVANLGAQKFLAKRFTPRQILLGTLPIFFLLLFFSPFPQSYFSFSLHFCLATFCAALIWTNAMANVSLSASQEIQGRIMGVNQSFAAIANIVAALSGGLIAAFNPSFVFFLSAFCILLALHFLRKPQIVE